MDSLFSDFERNAVSSSSQGPEARGWAPKCDVKEADGKLVIHADVPGVTKENMNVALDRGILTISGERKHEKKDESERWHRVERSYGSFSRSFNVGDSIKPEDIRASFANRSASSRLFIHKTVFHQCK
jgi:HSP20 family protein